MNSSLQSNYFGKAFVPTKTVSKGVVSPYRSPIRKKSDKPRDLDRTSEYVEKYIKWPLREGQVSPVKLTAAPSSNFYMDKSVLDWESEHQKKFRAFNEEEETERKIAGLQPIERPSYPNSFAWPLLDKSIDQSPAGENMYIYIALLYSYSSINYFLSLLIYLNFTFRA